MSVCVHACMYVATSQQIDRFLVNLVRAKIKNILFILRDTLFLYQSAVANTAEV